MCLDLIDPCAGQSFSPNLFLPTLVLQTTPVRQRASCRHHGRLPV